MSCYVEKVMRDATIQGVHIHTSLEQFKNYSFILRSSVIKVKSFKSTKIPFCIASNYTAHELCLRKHFVKTYQIEKQESKITGIPGSQRDHRHEFCGPTQKKNQNI